MQRTQVWKNEKSLKTQNQRKIKIKDIVREIAVTEFAM